MYKAQWENVNQIPEDPITISQFRDTYPRERFKTLEKSGGTIEQPCPGSSLRLPPDRLLRKPDWRAPSL